jgi:hypothetical protein
MCTTLVSPALTLLEELYVLQTLILFLLHMLRCVDLIKLNHDFEAWLAVSKDPAQEGIEGYNVFRFKRYYAPKDGAAAAAPPPPPNPPAAPPLEQVVISARTAVQLLLQQLKSNDMYVVNSYRHCDD